MKAFNKVLGFASDPKIAPVLHELSHHGQVEYLVLTREDAARKRLRAVTDRGNECLIAIPRNEALSDGAVLELGERAVIVRMADERWLTLRPTDQSAALELGYSCGNLHWRVRFLPERIMVALEGPEEDYLARLQPLLVSGKVRKDHPYE
jgi:urease accessory protein